MKPRSQLIAILVVCVGSVMAQEEPVTVDGIVARVNRDIITLSAYRRSQQELLEDLKRQGLTGKQLDDTYQQEVRDLLHTLIDTQLLVQKADELGVTVEAQINEYLIDLAKHNDIPPSQVDEMLTQMGLDPDQARQMLRTRFLREAVIGREVYPKIFQNIFDQDVEAYYREHIDNFTDAAAVKLSEILVKTEGRSQGETDRVVREIIEQLDAGADFASVARERSEGPTASSGGDIGWFKLDPRPELGEAQRNAIEGKEAGHHTDPIELADGIRIFHIDELQERKEQPLTPELRRKIQMMVAQQRAQPTIDEFVKKLRENAYIEIAEPYRPKKEEPGQEHGDSTEQK